jgi:hypothetical protein
MVRASYVTCWEVRMTLVSVLCLLSFALHCTGVPCPCTEEPTAAQTFAANVAALTSAVPPAACWPNITSNWTKYVRGAEAPDFGALLGRFVPLVGRLASDLLPAWNAVVVEGLALYKQFKSAPNSTLLAKWLAMRAAVLPDMNATSDSLELLADEGMRSSAIATDFLFKVTLLVHKCSPLTRLVPLSCAAILRAASRP